MAFVYYEKQLISLNTFLVFSFTAIMQIVRYVPEFTPDNREFTVLCTS